MPSRIQVTEPGVTDILAGLLGCSWRGVPFPLVSLETEGSNALVDHPMPDKNGFHVEDMGGNNLIVSATIPFRNGITPSFSEGWGADLLYPTVFRQFIAACAVGSTGPLVHPELGTLTAKCERFRWRYDPNKRDGTDVDVMWKQSLDDDGLLASISSPSPIAAAVAVAVQLDAQIAELTPPPPELAGDSQSFSDMMRALQAIPDTAALLSKQAGGILGRIGGQIDRVLDAVDRLNSVRFWPIRDGAEHLRSSLFDLEKRYAVDSRKIREYVVRKDTTLASLARILKTGIEDMMRLNPLLLEDPVVPAYAHVRYYVA